MDDWSPIKTPRIDRIPVPIDSTTDIYDQLFDPTSLSPRKHRDDSFSADVDAIETMKCEIAQLKTQLCDEKAQTSRIARCLHSTLLTARNQVNRCQQDINQLHNRLEELLLVVCPHCASSFTATTGSDDPMLLAIKPKYTRVIKGRRIVEVAFDDMDVLKRWLKYVNLHINSDGLPTLIDDATDGGGGDARSLMQAGSLLVDAKTCGNIENYRIPLKLASEPKRKLADESKQTGRTTISKDGGADENANRRKSVTIETRQRPSRDRRPDTSSRRRTSRDRSSKRGETSKYTRRVSDERDGRRRSRDRGADRSRR